MYRLGKQTGSAAPKTTSHLIQIWRSHALEDCRRTTSHLLSSVPGRIAWFEGRVLVFSRTR
jgi:hypothetical protein